MNILDGGDFNLLNNKFDVEKVRTIIIKKNTKRKLVKKIWESQLIKKYFYKVSWNMWRP